MRLVFSLAATFIFFWANSQHNMQNMAGMKDSPSQQRGTKSIGPVVEYNLYVNDTLVNFTGKKRKALAINGQIPAPTLKFTEGDSAVIHVHNGLTEEISIHWHGVLLPNAEDGVPLLNTPPIHAKSTHTFRFRIIQNGTLWYHSHSAYQEQEGLYGPLVFYPADEKKNFKNEEVLQLSDWRDESGKSVMRSLKRRNEWYAIQKKGVQSWGEAIAKGRMRDKVQMEWTRMPGADVSDVYYPVQLMQGKKIQTFDKYKKGDSIKLRIVNGSAATYYWLQYSGGKMRVISSDGNDVKPVEVDKLLIATAETYDIIIKIPENNQYEFRATAQDITASSSAFFGSGPQVKAKDIPELDYIVLMNEMNKMTWMMKGMGMRMKMGLSMKMDNMNGMGGMQMNGMDMDGMEGMDMKGMDSMNMKGMDSMNMKGMEGMDMKGMDSMDMKGMEGMDMKGMDSMNMKGMDHKQMAADTSNMKDMKGMDHSNMPGMKKTTPKKPTVTPKKTVKKPVKATQKKPDPMQGMDHSQMNMGPVKAPAKKPVPKKTPPKSAPKKAAPKKKDPMEGMDMKKMKMGFNPTPSTLINKQLALSLYGANLGYSTAQLPETSLTDTIPAKNKPTATPPMQGHDMNNMGTMKMDTTPKNKAPNPHANMNMPAPMPDQKANMKMSGMQGNMGGMKGMGGMNMGSSKTRDTSRSAMLMNMMPRTPMTGFDFPPGNGNDVVLSYDMLKSDTVTLLPANRNWREIEITLSGNMQTYVWSINGKTLSEQDVKVLIGKGENVRVVFTNATMMEHPMHLHGHFFRVINKQGAYAPMKHTFNINAMATQVIEFAATEEKDWFLHCHTIYHMVGGMATIFSYEGTESEVQKAYPRELKKFKKEHGSLLFPWANAAFHSQGTFGTLVTTGRKFRVDQDWRWDYKENYDLETRFQYFLDKRQFFSVFAGAQFERNNKKAGKIQSTTENTKVATAGLIYTFPFFINAEARFDHRGRFRFQLRREDIPITTRTRLDVYWNTDREFGVATRYIIAKYLAVSANYDFQYGWGAGISIIY